MGAGTHRIPSRCHRACGGSVAKAQTQVNQDNSAPMQVNQDSSAPMPRPRSRCHRNRPRTLSLRSHLNSTLMCTKKDAMSKRVSGEDDCAPRSPRCRQIAQSVFGTLLLRGHPAPRQAVSGRIDVPLEKSDRSLQHEDINNTSNVDKRQIKLRTCSRGG